MSKKPQIKQLDFQKNSASNKYATGNSVKKISYMDCSCALMLLNHLPCRKKLPQIVLF